MMSCDLVAVAPVVGIHEVANDPASICAFVTDPVTVHVTVPAVGVKVCVTRCVAPVPTSAPVAAPDFVIVPEP
jgi:hypothetical protein